MIYKYLFLQSLELVVLYKKTETELNTLAIPLGKKEDIGEKFNLDDLEEVDVVDLSEESINKSKSLILLNSGVNPLYPIIQLCLL